MSRERAKVVIVGGGFGGLEAAKALGDAASVTLIDRTNYHLFQPLLYQVAMAGLSPAEIAAPIRGIVAEQSNVRVVLGDVTDVDLGARRVHVDGEPLPYDWLLLAVGATTTYFGHDEWEPFAPSLKTLEDALEIRRRVLTAFERAETEADARTRQQLLTFVVIGGGPTGVELAGAVAELARFVLSRDFRSIDPREARVVLVEGGPRVLASFPEDLSRSAVEQLAELGAEVRTGARVVSIDGGGVSLEGGGEASKDGEARIASATVLWAAGVKPNALTASLGAPLDKQGRVLVEPDCSLPGHPEVFAIGDMARLDQDGKPLPGVSPVAMQQARHVARIVRGGARKPFHYIDKGSMATIGRSRAIAWARGIKMHGFIAWLAWLLIHIWYLIGFRSRLVVLLTWAWSYVSYKRGARLITATGWHPAAPRSPSPPAASRSPAADRPPAPAATPPA
jgi:NADH dehydrogenase